MRWLSIVSFAVTPAAAGFRVRDPPESVCASAGAGHVGYFDFDNDSKHLFFWLAESRSDPASDPVILWMSGGPGASSVAFGLFEELGPCIIDGVNATRPNPYAWNNHANVIFVDQPANVGFSSSSSPVKTLDDAMTDMYAFLTAFMERFPQYSQQDFYIVGESFGGTWVPALARKIHHRQSSRMSELVRKTTGVGERRINLRGIGLGNAQLSQRLQWPGFYPTGCLGENPIYNASVCAVIEETMPRCESMLGACSDSGNHPDVCDGVLDYCRKRSVYFIFDERLNPYDFRKPCPNGGLCYEEADWIHQYLNSSFVKRELRLAKNTTFNIIDEKLGGYYIESGDLMLDTVSWAGELLDQGYEVLVYAGNKDWFCNSEGEKNLVNNIRWRHQPSFRAGKSLPFKMGEDDIGLFKKDHGLTFVELFDAGHMVPADKPREALYMIESWINGNRAKTASREEL
ncbi:Carboxypeptidase Y [Colletotrichum spinosum]|uniref:carboxypeptidase C n=1 Tax=Colletotrichum spinosum TaxID=1347390 RepID=A0A4R8QBX1_9PEZI|nr:Carboxypeptidase Y [Colletotrichum spinosum]